MDPRGAEFSPPEHPHTFFSRAECHKTSTAYGYINLLPHFRRRLEHLVRCYSFLPSLPEPDGSHKLAHLRFWQPQALNRHRNAIESSVDRQLTAAKGSSVVSSSSTSGRKYHQHRSSKGDAYALELKSWNASRGGTHPDDLHDAVGAIRMR